MTDEEIREESMDINLESDLEHERLMSPYAGLDCDEIANMENVKMSTLSFFTKYINLEHGECNCDYLAFYFEIDGKLIETKEYHPADSWDILDKDAFNQNLHILYHCVCGIWKYGSLAARVKIISDEIIEWAVDEYRCTDNPKKYYFNRSEYDTTIFEMNMTAVREYTKNRIPANQRIEIIVDPDYDALFWDNEEYACGDAKSLQISESEEIEINIPGLENWHSTYINQVLLPCENGENSLDELNNSFDWIQFHKEGIKLLLELKKQLPDNVILKYRPPFEDQTCIINHELIIDDNEVYVANVLNKIGCRSHHN